VGRMKAVEGVLLLLLTVGGGSCSRMNMYARDTDLLATGLIGWQQIGGQQGCWHFDKGILYPEGEGGGWLSTTRPYDDFVLSLEFRVPPGGNSGVFLRAPQEGDPAYTGLEIQILDDYAEQWRDLQPYQYTGSIYDVQAPSERASRPAGQWQKMVIVARGPRIGVLLNGLQVIDTDLTYYPHKLETHPGLQRERGYIGLQSHSGRVEFRKIGIRELTGASRQDKWDVWD
jgi:hypothetical protein